MKISNLTETMATPSSMVAPGQPGAKFGRSDEMLESDVGTSVAGNIATVSAPMGKMQRRGQGSMFQGIKTSSKFANSRKAGIKEDAVNEDELSEEQLRAKQKREENFKKAKDRELGNKPKARDIQVNELSTEKLAQYKTAASKQASSSDKAGDYKRADKRFSGIVKATKKQFANDEKGVAEGFNGEYDDEAGMAESNLHTLNRAVEGLMNTIDSNDNLPEWCQEKIAKAEGMLTGVWDYMVSQKEQGIDPQQDVSEVAPPGAKAERMVKHIKKGYAKDGKLTPKEKSIAYATTWKAHNAGKVEEQGVAEEWSQKYKSGINCSHPKGFSQKAHCAGKKKHNESIETQVMEMTCPDCGMCETHSDHENLDEACWKGYHKEGNKKMFGKTYPNCVKNKGVAEEKKPDFMKSGNMKPFSVSGEEIPGAVHTLEKALLKAKERDIKLDYNNIDKIMQAVCKKHQLTGDELHNQFVEKHHMIPDNWIVKQLDEACWSTHKQVGMKNKGGRQVPNCVPKESIEEQHSHSKSCPHCGGEMVSEELMNEKKDACYYKVKSRYKVWPSAYASGALVKCRKKGAGNWGNGGQKSESMTEEELEESLHDWFNKEKWVRMDTKGNIKGPCAKEPGEGKPKCLPQSKAHSLGKKGRASAAARKRREDPNPDRSGKAINVNTKKKS